MTESNAAAQEAPQVHAAPVLTLHSEAENKKVIEQAVEMLNEMKAPVAPDAKEAIEALDATLTDEEKLQVAAFSKTIDLTNPDHVMLYGADAQKKISSFADTVLANVQTTDTGDVGDMLSNLVAELKGFSASGEKPRGSRAGSTVPKSNWPPCRPSTIPCPPTWKRSRATWKAIRYNYSRTWPCSTASTI